MKIFALADLHLSLSRPFDASDSFSAAGNKPMGIFGETWENHALRINEYWRDTVSPGDLVLIAGDISWAMTLDGARHDLAFIGSLPGSKIMIRGNHDYWWCTLKKIRAVLPESMRIIQNDAVLFDDFAVCGSRLWTLPSSPDFKQGDEKIYKRELLRLEMSLKAAEGKPVIAMTHYMPLPEGGEENEVSALLSRYQTKMCVYGHLHDRSHAIAVQGEHHGIKYLLSSADYLQFKPRLIAEI